MIKKLQHWIELILSITIATIVIVILAFAMATQYNENTSSLERQLRRAEDASYDSYYDSILDVRVKEAGDSDEASKSKAGDAFPESPSYAVFIEDADSLDTSESGSITDEASGDAGDVTVENNDDGIAYVYNNDADKDDVASLAKQMKETGNDSGVYSRYMYDIREIDDMKQITFIDTTILRRRLIPVFALSGTIGAVAVVAESVICQKPFAASTSAPMVAAGRFVKICWNS